MIKRLDQQLAAAGNRYATALEHGDNDADNPETVTRGQPVGTLGARSLNGTVTAMRVVGDTGHLVTITPADKPVVARLRPSARDRSIALPTFGAYRVQVTSGLDGDVLVTGLPLHDVEQTLDRLQMIEVIVFVVVLVVTGVIGVVAVRWSLRPLSRVATTAMRVSDLPLETGEVRLHERQLIADASHELRTPLSVIRGHSELVHRDLANVPPEIARSLHRIDGESTRMARLVDDLLLLARLDTGRPLDREDVDLTRLAIDAMGDAQAAGPDHRWLLDLPEEPVQIIGDAYRLHEVVANLLANARVHTGAGTTVTLAVTPDSAAGVRIEVRDDGPGIPADVQPTAFERFSRADNSRNRANGGSGLGLAIVRAVVSAHGGAARVDSRPGQTTVTVWLPLR